MSLLATPFHARAAELSRNNVWETRNGFTLASCYGRTDDEALAARFGAVLADISWHWRIEIAGLRAVEFVSRLFTRNPASLMPGMALEALWLNDAGAVRGAGTLARTGEDSFRLVAALEDADWIARAARLYGVTIADKTAAEGGLALIGPAASKVLDAAGLDGAPEPMSARRVSWRGLDVTLSRFGLGYELWCEPDIALIAWDRLVAAGQGWALRPAGQAALDILEFESGLMRAGRDYRPARDGFAPQPSPQSLGLGGLVDRSHIFNGRAGVFAGGPDSPLSGVLLDGEKPVPGAVLTHQGRALGRTLSSRFSPAMRCAIAFAIVPGTWPASGLMAGTMPCRAAALPFLPIPAPMDATEPSPAAV